MADDLNPNAEASKIETSGYASLRFLQNQSSNSSNTNILSATALLRSRVNLDHDTLAFQLRPLLDYTNNSGIGNTSVYVDELYWEHRFSASSFTFLGRRKIVNGVAMGRNPTDFFNQNKTQNRTLNDEDRRAETEGDNMVGWSYFGRTFNIQSLIATPSPDSKRIRTMLQINSSLNSLSTDVSFSAYYADRLSLGMSLSTVLGEKTTVYAEAALRKGRDRKSPVLSANDVVIGAVDDSSRWITDFVLGGQYTTDNGITLTTEYWRNNNGFSHKEYTGIANSLTSGKGNPRLAGSLLSTPGLRKNSTFVRIGDVQLTDTLKGEVAWIHNLDDSSNFLRAAVNWDVGKTDSLRIGVDGFSGSKLSEYGSSKINKRFFLAYKKYF